MELNRNFGAWVIRNRWGIIAGSLIVLAISASGGQYLGFNNDNRVFFSKDDPRLVALEEIENTFTKNDNVFIALEAKTGDIFTREILSAAEKLTAAAWRVPYSSRVDSLTNYQHTLADGDDLVVGDLVVNAGGLTDHELARIKKIALSDPLLLNSLISPSGNIMGINITILNPGKSNTEITDTIKFVRHMIKEFKGANPEINVYITGAIPFDNAFGEVSMDDMAVLTPIMYSVMITLIWLLLRSFAGAFATLLIIAFSTFTGLGITGWLGILITPASAVTPTIIMTLSVADSIHILATMFNEMQMGKSKDEAIIESMRINLQPVFLTSLTTAIGFLSMNASDAPPFRDLGNIVAIGVAAAFFYSVMFLPALMAVLPVRVKVRRKSNHLFIERLGGFVVNRRRELLWGMLVFIVFLVAGIYKINLNDRFVSYFDERYLIRTDTDHIVENNLTGMDLIEYSIGAGKSNGITDPEYLEYLEKFANWYRKQPGVVHVSVFTDVMKQLNRSMHGDDQAYYRIPEDRSLAAQFLLLYEMSLPFGLDLNNRINIDKSATRFMVTTKGGSTRKLMKLDNRVREWMMENLPDYMVAYGSGLSIIWAYISERNINSMLYGTAIALFLISIVLIGALRSWKYGLISLAPNLIPAFMAFGLWGYCVGEVGLAVSVVGAMSLGIVVDDTIHFLTKYIRARKELGMNAEDAVKRSFHTVGTAIVITTVVLVSGFMVLTFSGFLLTSSMGMLTAIALGFALFADCLFLPPLLMKVD